MISMNHLDDAKCLEVILGKLFDAINQLYKGLSLKALANRTLILNDFHKKFLEEHSPGEKISNVVNPPRGSAQPS